jgi:hypothetical protein
MKEKKRRGGPREGAGRDPLSPDSPTVRVNTSMTEAQRDKFHRLGGSEWLRRMIDEAEEEPEV